MGSLTSFKKEIPDMLDKLTHETFSKLNDKAFRIHTESGETLDVELIKVEDHAERVKGDPEHRKPFSIVFKGPKDKELTQETYKLEHASLGSLEIHLVPIVGPQDSDEKWYEAVFN
jgi:hypothetical protein